jgi:transposase
VLVEIAPGFTLDPFAPCLFAFCNRERDKINIPHCDHDGFWLYYRRLEKGRLTLP